MIEVTDANFEAEVLKSDLPVIVDFWAAWCGPCKMIAPIFEELAGRYAGKMKFAKYDVDRDQKVAAEYGIRGIPALYIFKGGQVAEKVIGYTPKQELEKRIQSVLT